MVSDPNWTSSMKTGYLDKKTEYYQLEDRRCSSFRKPECSLRPQLIGFTKEGRVLQLSNLLHMWTHLAQYRFCLPHSASGHEQDNGHPSLMNASGLF